MKTTHSLIKVVLGALVLLGAVSCSKDLYNEEQYEEYIKYNSPVDSVDQFHDWKLTEERSYQITANVSQDIEKVLLLTENPLTSKTARVMSQCEIAKGESKWLTASVPLAQTILYAALVDKEGQYYVKSFRKILMQIDFSDVADMGKPVGTLKPQTYTYIFEHDFPVCGDYDYNDLVMRIGMERTAPKQVAIHVTLAAVGCDVQLAGFIRLLGCYFEDIDSVTTVDGKTFDDKLPDGSKQMVNNVKTFRTGQKGTEPVITLFNDAHWALDSYQSTTTNSGTLSERKFYNTSISYDGKFASRAPATQTYLVYFKSSEVADVMSLESIDPFIVAYYNGARYETHLDNLKAAQVLYPYNVEAKIKDLPWALLVPSASFMYPLEEVQLGFRKRTESGAVFNDGAYATTGHSFGEWVENHQSSLDWYDYSNKQKVWTF